MIFGLVIFLPFYVVFKGGEPLWQIYRSDHNLFQIILSLRLNAGIAAIVCGAGLAACGLFLQTLFQNPLSSPYTLGVSSVSSMFIAFYILVGNIFPFLFTENKLVFLVIQFGFSLFGAVLSLFLILKIQKRTFSNSLIVLVGILIGTFASSITQIMEYLMSKEQLKTNFLWNLGSFEIFDNRFVFVLVIGIGICLVMYYKKISDSNLFLLGHIYAQNAGLNIRFYQKYIFLISAVLIALITALCGPIGFIGLISPHIAKLILKVNHHKSLFYSTILIGANYAMICLIISHSQLFGTQIPINTISALIGVPFTIYLMLKYFGN